MFLESLNHFSPEDCVFTADFTARLWHAQQTVDATQGDIGKLNCLIPKIEPLFLWRWKLRRHLSENVKNAHLVETERWPNFICFGSWANKCEQSFWCPLKPLQRRLLILARSFDTLWGLQCRNERKILTKPEIKGRWWMLNSSRNNQKRETFY